MEMVQDSEPMQGHLISNVVSKNVCFVVLPQHQGHIVPLNSGVSCERIGSTCVQCDAYVCMCVHVCDECLYARAYRCLCAHVVVGTRESSNTNELSFWGTFL